MEQSSTVDPWIALIDSRIGPFHNTLILKNNHLSKYFSLKEMVYIDLQNIRNLIPVL